LLAFALPKPPTATTAAAGGAKERQLRYITNIEAGKQDILKPFQLEFPRRVSFDSTKIVLTDKDFKPVDTYQVVADTNGTRFTIRSSWPPNTAFNLLLDKNAFADSAGLRLPKNDTVRFTTKTEEEYGTVRIRFKNIDLSKNPVLQLVQNDKVVDSIPLLQPDWSRKLFPPGDYNLRILYDANKNGKWDPGRFFGERRQPEVVININTTFNVRANWDNEKEITLQ
jgi:hypothetical protein